MPQVQLKYQVTLDAMVSLNELKFEGEDFNPVHLDGKDNIPDQKIYIDDHIHVKMLTSGSAGSWTIAIWVMELDDNNEPTGEWKPCDKNGKTTFTDDVDINNRLSGSFLIKW